jgi:actin-like ATPase involved in cell morphogenesis
MILTGGGALLSGLDNYVSDQTRLSARLADEPRYAIVRGLEQMFAEPLWLRRVMRCRSDQFVDFERDISALET